MAQERVGSNDTQRDHAGEDSHTERGNRERSGLYIKGVSMNTVPMEENDFDIF